MNEAVKQIDAGRPHIKRVLSDVEVVIDLYVHTKLWRDGERHAVAVERAVKEFEDFLRDHRSQDVNRMDVRRVYQNRCSECDHEYEAWVVSLEDCDGDPMDPALGEERCIQCGAVHKCAAARKAVQA